MELAKNWRSLKLYQSMNNIFSDTFFALNANFYFFLQKMKAIKTLDFYLANNSGVNYSKK